MLELFLFIPLTIIGILVGFFIIGTSKIKSGFANVLGVDSETDFSTPVIIERPHMSEQEKAFRKAVEDYTSSNEVSFVISSMIDLNQKIIPVFINGETVYFDNKSSNNDFIYEIHGNKTEENPFTIEDWFDGMLPKLYSISKEIHNQEDRKDKRITIFKNEMGSFSSEEVANILKLNGFSYPRIKKNGDVSVNIFYVEDANPEDLF